MTTKEMRNDPLFMRNSFLADGKWEIPCINNQEIDTRNLKLIACLDTKANEREENRKFGVYFFVDDYRFNGIYNNPKRTLKKYSQYKFLLSSDFSAYSDMNPWRHIENVAKNRWVGAYWQSKGLTVIPTISWSTPRSFDFCFDGVEQNSIVAVSTLGCKRTKLQFMRGYDVMLDKLKPKTIICFGDPFSEMSGNIVRIDYRASRKVVR